MHLAVLISLIIKDPSAKTDVVENRYVMKHSMSLSQMEWAEEAA